MVPTAVLKELKNRNIVRVIRNTFAKKLKLKVVSASAFVAKKLKKINVTIFVVATALMIKMLEVISANALVAIKLKKALVIVIAVKKVKKRCKDRNSKTDNCFSKGCATDQVCTYNCSRCKVFEEKGRYKKDKTCICDCNCCKDEKIKIFICNCMNCKESDRKTNTCNCISCQQTEGKRYYRSGDFKICCCLSKCCTTDQNFTCNCSCCKEPDEKEYCEEDQTCICNCHCCKSIKGGNCICKFIAIKLKEKIALVIVIIAKKLKAKNIFVVFVAKTSMPKMFAKIMEPKKVTGACKADGDRICGTTCCRGTDKKNVCKNIGSNNCVKCCEKIKLKPAVVLKLRVANLNALVTS